MLSQPIDPCWHQFDNIVRDEGDPTGRYYGTLKQCQLKCDDLRKTKNNCKSFGFCPEKKEMDKTEKTDGYINYAKGHCYFTNKALTGNEPKTSRTDKC